MADEIGTSGDLRAALRRVADMVTPADKLAEAAIQMRAWCVDDEANAQFDAALTAFRSAKDGGYHVTITGQYDAASHCVVTSHGEPLVAFETDAGSLAPLDGKAVTVTVRGE